MAERERVAADRKGLTRRVDACGFRLYVTVNFYADGRPSEVFITIAKRGSIIAGFARTFAVILSIALQSGVPWPVLYGKMHGVKFDPFDGKYESLVDAIASVVNKLVEKKKRSLECQKTL